MKKRLVLFLLASFATANMTTTVAAQTPQFTPLTSFGTQGDGMLYPGERSYLTAANNLQRGIAFNPITGHLLIANRSPVSAPTINIIDGTTAEDLGAMAFEPMVLGGNVSFYLNKIAVADDGAVYAANLSSASTATIQYTLYRYESETGGQTLVYFGDPSNGAATSSQSNGRWGDNIAVRGAGTNTQILISSQGTLAAILSPTDETMTSFIAQTLATDASSGGLADSLSFGPGNTFWGKGNGFGLRLLSFDLNAGTATTIQSEGPSTFPSQIGPIVAINASNLLAGIEIAPNEDFVKLYDISTSPPVFLDRENYRTNLPNARADGEICFGNGRLYALNSDNGILALSLILSNELVAPSFFMQPVNGGSRVIGSNVTFTALADGIPTNITYQWYFNQTNLITDATNTSLSLSNLQITNSGSYSVVANNSAGSTTSSIVTLSVVPDSILYVYEPFNYDVGLYLTNCTLAPGQTWSTNGSTAADSIVTSGSLTIAGLAPSIGNSFTNGGGGAAARLPMGSSQNSGAVYASFAMRINNLGAFNSASANGLIASFVNNAGNDQVGRFVVRTNGPGNYSLGVGKVTTAGVIATNQFLEGETVFVVLRYTFVEGSANDLADLWLNPSPLTFGTASAPAPTVSAVITGTDVSSIDTWAFRQNSSANTPANIQYDELRIANKWELVTPTAAVPISLNIAVNGDSVVLSWPVSGSDGFELETASALSSPISWLPVEEPVVVQGQNNTVTIDLGSAPAFFQLRK